MVGFLKIEILENLPVMKASDRLWSTILRYLAEPHRTLESKLQNIKEASMRKVEFQSDQNKMSMQKKSQCQKVNEKSKETIYLCTQLFDTLVTPISEYGIELRGF